MKEFGENLKEAMMLKGISQIKLAQEIGVTSTSVNYYANGNRQPSIETIRKLCEILEVTPNELFGIYEYQLELKREKMTAIKPAVNDFPQNGNRPFNDSQKDLLHSENEFQQRKEGFSAQENKDFSRHNTLSEAEKKSILIENIRQTCKAFEITAEDVFGKE